ncbi:MAG TPA: hypothetical protein VNE41_09725 [Chitinophagaceae bacterium]|nr:hypothetical protein [Chitinophagaceae bacterium]
MEFEGVKITNDEAELKANLELGMENGDLYPCSSLNLWLYLVLKSKSGEKSTEAIGSKHYVSLK